MRRMVSLEIEGEVEGTATLIDQRPKGNERQNCSRSAIGKAREGKRRETRTQRTRKRDVFHSSMQRKHSIHRYKEEGLGEENEARNRRIG